MPKSQWFVIHTLSGQEHKVKENIEKRIKAEEMSEYIKEVLVPVEKVVDVRGGKKTVIGFFVGAVMKASKGKANPALVNELLAKKLEG